MDVEGVDRGDSRRVGQYSGNIPCGHLLGAAEAASSLILADSIGTGRFGHLFFIILSVRPQGLFERAMLKWRWLLSLGLVAPLIITPFLPFGSDDNLTLLIAIFTVAALASLEYHCRVCRTNQSGTRGVLRMARS
jgi:hypothetical protein